MHHFLHAADVIFGAVEEGWLVRSTDGGESWVNIKQGTEFDSHTVTILPDTGRNYLSKLYDDEWMRAQGFDVEE